MVREGIPYQRKQTLGGWLVGLQVTPGIKSSWDFGSTESKSKLTFLDIGG